MGLTLPQGDLRLVPATDADAQGLADLRAAAMRPSLQAIGRFDPVRARDRFLSTFVAEDTRIILVGNQRAGVVVLRQRPDHLYLDHLYLTGTCQGRGIGGWVIDLVQARARALGLPIRLVTLTDSPAARFYQGRGFVPIAMTPPDTPCDWRAS